MCKTNKFFPVKKKPLRHDFSFTGRFTARPEKRTHEHYDTHTGRTLEQYNVSLRDMFLETFCTTKTAIDNPLMQPSATGQRKSFLVLEKGDFEGTNGYWAEDEEDSAE